MFDCAFCHILQVVKVKAHEMWHESKVVWSLKLVTMNAWGMTVSMCITTWTTWPNLLQVWVRLLSAIGI